MRFDIKIMKLLISVVVMVYGNAGITAFLLDPDPTTKGTTLTTTNPDWCSIDVFANCTEAIRTIVYANGTNVNIDTDALINFYCGPDATKATQCLKDHINPNCGHDTAAAAINRTLAHMPTDYSYDSICRNTTGINELLRCQALFPNLKGFRDCVTGETLNKTLDPLNDRCNFLEATLACSYKYTEIMCPSVMNAFRDSAKYAGDCTINYENIEEARSCDQDMGKACDAAYDVPSYKNVSGIVDFACSERGREYQQCLHKVYGICKDKNGLNISQLNNSLEYIENQTALTCSEENNNLTKCTALFSKVDGYRDCITGVTLNKTVDPTDICTYFQTTMGCTKKYTNLICPEEVDTLQKISQIPPSCTLSIKDSPEVKSCDRNMVEACLIGYNIPAFNGSETAEFIFDFTCSDRNAVYLICAQKVISMCSWQGVDVSGWLNSVQIYSEQTAFMCSDKTGYIAYTTCGYKLFGSDEYVNCMSNLNASDICGYTTAFTRCALNGIQKTCPTSTAYFKRYMSSYNSLIRCNTTSAFDIPFTVPSSSNHQDLSKWALVIFVSFSLFKHFLV